MATRKLTDPDDVPDLSDTILVVLQFFDLSDDQIPKDPTSVRYIITRTDPDTLNDDQFTKSWTATNPDPKINHVGPGAFELELFIDVIGDWEVTGEGAGAIVAADTVAWNTPAVRAHPSGRFT